MTRIHDLCPTCGVVVLTAAEITLLIGTDPAFNCIKWKCRTCHHRIVRHVSDTARCELVRVGVAAQIVGIVPELAEPHHGPVLCRDDELEFWEQLRDEDDLAGLAAASSVTPPRRPGGDHG